MGEPSEILPPRLVSHPSPAPGKNTGLKTDASMLSPPSDQPATSREAPRLQLLSGSRTMTSKPSCKLNSEFPETPAVHFRGTQPRNPVAQVSLGLPLFWGAEQGRAPAAGNAPKGRPDGRGQLRNRWRPPERAEGATSDAAELTEGREAQRETGRQGR